MELIAIGISLDLWLIKWWTIYVLFHAWIVLSELMVIKLQNCWNVRFGLLYYIMLWLANSHSGSLKGSVHAALHIGPPPLPESLSSATPYWALPQPLTSSSRIEIFEIFCIPCSFQQCNNSPVDSHTSTVGKKKNNFLSEGRKDLLLNLFTSEDKKSKTWIEKASTCEQNLTYELLGFFYCR